MKYDSSDIQTLRFPDSIRNNVSMYLGSTDEHGRWLIARELLDNGLDEALAGRNKGNFFVEDPDGSYWVMDFGAGIPQGVKSFDINVNGKLVKNTISTMQAIFTEMHTSGKFRNDAYQNSIGTHGVGAKGTNATSEFFEVFTYFKNEWFSIKFKKGLLTSPVTKLDKAPKGPFGITLKKGTCIHFKPDATIFGKGGINLDYVKQWAEITSYLTPGFSVVLVDKNKAKTKYFSEEGPREYVNKLLTQLKGTAEKIYFEYHSDLCDIVIAFSDIENCNVKGYTNGLFNSEGGKHVDSLIACLYDSTKKYIKAKQSFSVYNFKEGLVGLVNIKLHKAEFSSQDKSRLTDARAGDSFREVLQKETDKFFANNKQLALRLCEKASKLSQLMDQFKASKKVVTALNTIRRKGLPSKYAPYDSRTKIEDRELLIVEGNSAGGGIREERMPWQSLLPLRGKILNVKRSGKNEKALESEEIINILGAIGFDPKASDPLSKLQVSKVICLADGDPDGRHINTLLLTLFHTYLPEMFDRGMIYVADMPEFYALYKDKFFSGDTISEVRKKMNLLKVPSSVEINHIKGWGEIDACLMKILAIDPNTRKLIKIQAVTKDQEVTFNKLMTDDVQFRKQLLGLAEEV